MRLRNYQARIVETAVVANTIVLLPTGSGKTLVAAEVIRRIGTPSFVFVPTIPLVCQQASAIRNHIPTLEVGEFNGDSILPKSFDILVTTPKAFEVAQSRGIESLSWMAVKLIIFDEVHHAIKDHPYRHLALKLKQSSASPRVVGLTASLTYAVGEKKINKSVGRLCQELQIEKIESASDKELRDGGYQGAGQGAIAELCLPNVKRTGNLVPPALRKPHLMHQMFFDRIKKKEATPFSTELVKVIHVLETVLKSDIHAFKSPLPNVSLKSWGVYAKKQSHMHDLYPKLEHFYEALRLLVVSWEENEDIAIAYLKMMKVHCSKHQVSEVNMAITSFFNSQQVSLVRFENLFTILEDKLQQYKQDFRCIIFVQQRVTTHIMKHIIEDHKDLGLRIKAQCIYSTKTPATPSLSISKSVSESALKSFGTGKSNMLIATNVAEEGLDIPEANCVIRFDPMDHAVSYVQGRGRARHSESTFVVLAQRIDRPISLLAEQEIEQQKFASLFVPGKKNTRDLTVNSDNQRTRERSGASYLLQPSVDTSIANLHIYCNKTKVILKETFSRKEGQEHSWSCALTYLSVTRNVSSNGTSMSKKAAKKVAAVELLKAIKFSIDNDSSKKKKKNLI